MTADSASTMWIAAVACLVLGGLLLAAVAARRDVRMPAYVRDYLTWLDGELLVLRSKWRARQVLAMQVAAAVISLSLGAAFDPLFAVAAVAPFALVRLLLRAATQRRRANIEQQLSGWLIGMANVLKVSGSVSDALRQSRDTTKAPLGDELDRTLNELGFGMPLDAALRSLAERVGSPSLSAAVTTLVIGRRTGGALPTLLDATATAARERLRLERVFRQQLTAARLQFMTLALGPPLLVAGLDKLQPGFFDPLFMHPFGPFVLVGAAALWLISVLLARRIMNHVL